MTFKKLLIIWVIFPFVIACQGDYTKEIGNTGLTYVDSGKRNRSIIKIDGRIETTVIDSEVHAFFNEGDQVYGLRQVLERYHCKNPASIIREITNRLEFFVITVLDENLNYERVIFTEFLDFKSHLEGLGVSVENANKLLPELHEKNIYPSRIIGKCNHPLEIIERK